MRRIRLTVGVRLMVILATVAVFSTFAALWSQDRALSHDLSVAARARLERASSAASLLLEQHLGRMADRYASISHTPEFRANLRVGNAPTLSYYARLLAEDQRAEAVVFLDADGTLMAAVGDAAVVEAATSAFRTSGSRDGNGAPHDGDGASHDGDGESAPRCIRGEPEPLYGPSLPPTLSRFVDCSEPAAAVQSTLVGLGRRPFVVAAVPLLEGSERVGTLVVSDAIDPETLVIWSMLCGADVSFGPPVASSDSASEAVVHRAAGIELRARQSLAIEREALAHARQNLVGAGVLAAIVAMLASVLLARSFVHPILAILAATRRVGRGELETEVAVSRDDELGDVALAFNTTVASLRRSHARVEIAQRLARFSDWGFDLESQTVEGSAEFTRIFAFGGKGPFPLRALLERIHPDDRRSFRSLLTTCAVEGRPFRVDVRSLRPDGDIRILHIQGQQVEEGDDSVRVQASAQDVTQQKRFEEQIRLLAYDDSLTGIGNRRYFAQQLEKELELAQLEEREVALLFLDLDRFKNINDTMGHSAGDELLQQMSSRIVSTLQDALHGPTRPRITVARLGGDEFTVLLADLTENGVVEPLAQKLLDALAAPCSIQGQQVVVTGSIGISLSPRDGTTAEDLVRSGDTAMYHAKGAGRNRYRFYEPSMQEAAMERWQLENRLRRAIDREELRVHYQPRTRVDSGLITQVEALLRWRDPELGAVSPDDFIAVAEDSGLICGLGSWVLVQALEQVRAWRDDGWEIGVSVNLSSHQIQPGLVLEVASAFERLAIDPGWVEFEVTESALLADQEVGIDVLQRLRALGSRISLDDFGTGYSSLSHLARLPVDALKIDRSFVEDIASDPDAAGLVAAIVATAKVLRLDVVAEGVETEIQRDLLEEMGCDEMQGFLFGHAINAEAVTQLLRETEQGRKPPKKSKKRAPRSGKR